MWLTSNYHPVITSNLRHVLRIDQDNCGHYATIPLDDHFAFLAPRSSRQHVKKLVHFTVLISSVVTVTSLFDPLSALKTVSHVSIDPETQDRDQEEDIQEFNRFFRSDSFSSGDFGFDFDFC